jgi:hypothetical protein
MCTNRPMEFDHHPSFMTQEGKTTMKKKLNLKHFSLLMVTTVLVLAQLACSLFSSSTSPTATTAPGKTQESAATATSPQNQAQTPVVVATSTTRPTSLSATATPASDQLTILSQGFGQNAQEVGYGFLVKNSDPTYAYEYTEYKIAAYNAAGTVVETSSGYISLILPGQTLGIASSLYLSEGVTVSEIKFSLVPGTPVDAGNSLPFTASQAVYYPNDYYPEAMGLITNPYSQDITDLTVYALVYNSAGEIIGGGSTYLYFILANRSTGVDVYVTSAGTVAYVELYPAMTSLTDLTPTDTIPVDAQEPTLEKQGYGQNGTEVGYGLLIKNPNSTYAIEDSQYHITLFAADGTILATEEWYADLLLPNQTLGIGGDIYLNDATNVASIDVQFKSGKFIATTITQAFTSKNVAFLPDLYYPKITGEIVNPFAKDLSSLEVAAIAFDAAGNIIGGGYTYIDFAPAESSIAVEAYVTTSGTPATVNLYASVSALADIS